MCDASPGLLQPLIRLFSSFVINNSTYIGQNVPTLYSALSVGGNYSSDPRVYGHVNPYVVKHNDIVEIVINNLNSNLHPWHLHGHQFQVLERTLPNTGSFPGTYSNFSSTPVRRDTVMLQPNAYAVIRFRADNPDKLPFSISVRKMLTTYTHLAVPLPHRVPRHVRLLGYHHRSPGSIRQLEILRPA